MESEEADPIAKVTEDSVNEKVHKTISSQYNLPG